MAEEDVRVKNFLTSYVIPLVIVVVGVVVMLSANKNKVLSRRFSAWITDKLLVRMHRKLEKQKTLVFADIHGQALDANVNGRQLQILEIGSGSGMNFKFFPEGSNLTCVDPNPYHRTYLEKNRASVNAGIRMGKCIVGYAEDMPEVETGSCDAVVCTLVLCTVRDVGAVLGEIKRVLKHGGIFYFVEHVAARSRLRRRLQDFLNPMWKMCTDGCNLNRETWTTLVTAQFRQLDLAHHNVNIWPMMLPLIYGKAVK